jgi:hypothetical protein
VIKLLALLLRLREEEEEGELDVCCGVKRL